MGSSFRAYIRPQCVQGIHLNILLFFLFLLHHLLHRFWFPDINRQFIVFGANMHLTPLRDICQQDAQAQRDRKHFLDDTAQWPITYSLVETLLTKAIYSPVISRPDYP